ncbi:MAG: hypothetical protein LKM39_14930 [Chiayiivirga sp.]|jgi:uncharacterized protein YcfL|nr:hypothetical protein [Chiayiivirga sp.]
MRKRSLCLTIPILLATGCQSGPPGCSDTQTLEILDELLDDQARISTILGLLGYEPFGYAMLGHATDWLGKAQSGSMDHGEAYLELTERLATLSMQKGDDVGVRMLTAGVTAARYSAADVSGVTTLDRNERRTSCSATVTYRLNWPTAQELGVADAPRDRFIVDRLREAMGTVAQDIEFTTYYADDGTHYVEYVELEE